MSEDPTDTSPTEDANPEAGQDAAESAPASTQSAEFANLEENQKPGAIAVEAETVQHIPVTLSVEVGRSAISIQEVLQLNQGSVVQLDRAAGEPMDIRINGCLMAHGEVVVVNDQFGVRLTSIVSASQRANRFG